MNASLSNSTLMDLNRGLLTV